MKKVWDKISKITGKKSNRLLNHLNNASDEPIVNKKDIANELGNNFKNCSSSNNYSSEFQNIKSTQERRKINFKTKISFNYNKKFKLRDLNRSLKKSNNSAPGVDQIHYQILRHLPVETKKIFIDLINEYWNKGDFPPSWREALIIPIPKPGKDPLKAINYRPIALTSCMCKVVERMVNERLIWYLEKHGLLSPYQSGFRAHRGTIDHLVRLETFIRNAFVQGHHVVAVFFDLQKAYDTTWKYGILKDLHDLGLRGNLPIFISNFLDDRTFQVLYSTTLSDTFTQEEGVPQGAILSTTLFNIKVNNITKAIASNIDCSLYVDDFLICYSSPSIIEIERQLQISINNLQTWTLHNGFTISAQKLLLCIFAINVADSLILS